MKYRIIYIWIIEVIPMSVNSNDHVINTEINANNANEVLYARAREQLQVASCIWSSVIKNTRSFGIFLRKIEEKSRHATIWPVNNIVNIALSLTPNTDSMQVHAEPKKEKVNEHLRRIMHARIRVFNRLLLYMLHAKSLKWHDAIDNIERLGFRCIVAGRVVGKC